tara:strand:+ start:1053 stop:1313 length:261 start_codon:yes stop_codon:yes gene_type:complete
MSITINMTKAKEIHRKHVREARTPLLASLDTDFQRALETSSDTAAIVAKKQALRDAPANAAIDAAKTPDELKAAWDTATLGTTPYK